MVHDDRNIEHIKALGEQAMKKLFIWNLLMLTVFSLVFISCQKAEAMKSDSHKMYKIVIITPLSHPSLDQAIDGFIKGLNEKGFDKGKINFEVMNANGDFAKIPSLTKSAILKQPNLIFVLTTPAASTAIKITNKANIPLVYTAVTDPVAAGIVTSMDKSETLATGVSDRYPVKKQIKLFLSILPGMKSCGILYNPSEENSRILVRQTIEAMSEYNINCVKYEIKNASEIPAQTQKILASHDCVIVNGDNLATENLSIIINLCIKNKKPLFVGDPNSVRNGAVATVGPNYYSLGLKSGLKAAQILNGESPKSIPSEYPTEFDYIINTKAAKDMGIKIPASFWESREIWESLGKTNTDPAHPR